MHNPLRAVVTLGAAMLLLGAGESPSVDLQTMNSSAIPVSGPENAPDNAISPLAPEPDLGFVLPAADTLAEMVADIGAAGAPSLEQQERCLASAVYYESKGEPLNGQLAVAQVVLNRVANGRFGQDICAVVKAPKQFGFVRGGHFAPPARDRQWAIAKAIALIAIGGGWPEIAPDATHFHATRVNPRWNLRQVATIGGHIFYR